LYRDFSYLLNWYKSYLKESQRRITTQHEELYLTVSPQQVDNSAYQPVEEVSIMRKESIIIVKTKERK